MALPISFETFKSDVCHRVKDIGDIPFIIETLKSNRVRQLYDQKQYEQALYLLAMVDYLSRENDLPRSIEYRDIRNHRLSRRLYPQSVLALAYATRNEEAKEQSWRESIPEFRQFNIVESDVRHVV